MPRNVILSFSALAVLLTGCSTTPQQSAYEREHFTQNGVYARAYQAPYAVACDAGRRALLSQGYNIDKASNDTVSGHKMFLEQDGSNTQITFNINCSQGGASPSQSQVFVNAVQDRYTVKQTSTPASVGVGILGNISLPFSSTDDSLVKIGSLTVSRPQFYSGFFELLEQYLPIAKSVAEHGEHGEHGAAADKPANKPADQSADKPVEKPVEKAPSEPAEQTPAPPASASTAHEAPQAPAPVTPDVKAPEPAKPATADEPLSPRNTGVSPPAQPAPPAQDQPVQTPQ